MSNNIEIRLKKNVNGVCIANMLQVLIICIFVYFCIFKA